jgi:hypothetical protein
VAYSLNDFIRTHRKTKAVPRSHGGMYFSRGVLPSQQALLNALVASRAEVICDTGIFQGRSAEFATHLLPEKDLWITPEVQREVATYFAQPPHVDVAGWRRQKKLIAANAHQLRILSLSPTYANMYYANILFLRKQVPALTGDSQSVKEAWRRIAEGSSAMSRKKNAGHVPSDELLVTAAFGSAILERKRVFLLTQDNDVVLQSYKLASFINDVYLSNRLARDYRTNRQMYSAPLSTKGVSNLDDLFDPSTSVAIGRRAIDVWALMKPADERVGVTVTLLKDIPEFVRFRFSRETDKAWRIKSLTRGRNTQLFGDMNLHGHLHWVSGMFDRSHTPYMFLVNDVKFPGPNPLGIVMADFLKAVTDVETPLTGPLAAIPTAGLPTVL